MRYVAAILLATIWAVTLGSNQAEADWQYTKWGMSVDEVIAAGQGQVSKASAEEQKNEKIMNGNLVGLAVGTYSINESKFTATFLFQHGKLDGVKLRPIPVADPYKVTRQLNLIYGLSETAKGARDPATHCPKIDSKWRDESGENVIEFYELDRRDRCVSGIFFMNPALRSRAVVFNRQQREARVPPAR